MNFMDLANLLDSDGNMQNEMMVMAFAATMLATIPVLLGNEFDINVGLKKKRRKRSEKVKMTPDLFFAKIMEAINAVHFTVEDSDSNDVIVHHSDSSDVIKPNLNLPTRFLSPESNAKPDFEDNPEWEESSSGAESFDSKEKWFYAQKIKQLLSDQNVDNNL